MSRTRRCGRITASLAAVIAAILIGGFATVAGAATPTSYVALGDS